MAAAPGEQEARTLVDHRSDGFCERCGEPGATDKAHRIGRGVRGTWEASNILDLCRACHSDNHRHPARAYTHGWHLCSTADPQTVPVWFHHNSKYGYARLHNDGTFTWVEREPNDG